MIEPGGVINCRLIYSIFGRLNSILGTLLNPIDQVYNFQMSHLSITYISSGQLSVSRTK